MTTATQPLVVIVVLSVNQKTDTLQCLASLREIDYRNARVIVVDNGSTDGTAAAVRQSFPDVILIESAINTGAAQGRNIAIAHANRHFPYDYLLFLDNDTRVGKTFLRELIDALQAQPACGLAFPKVFFMDRPDIFQWAGNYELDFHTGKVVCRASHQRDTGQFDRPTDSQLASGCCLLAKRAVLQAVEGFDTIYDPYGWEDLDFCMRATRNGFHILYVPSASIWHKSSRTISQGRYDEVYARQKGINMKIFMKRYATPWQWFGFWCNAPRMAFRTLSREIRRKNFRAALVLFKGFLFPNRPKP
ncbi:MAG: glycosyltransferase family 2 protein [Lentisphaeria bacterium]|nr:glycosyltransferase family 2 protein [Lentisphaeria bacterium]